MGRLDGRRIAGPRRPGLESSSTANERYASGKRTVTLRGHAGKASGWRRYVVRISSIGPRSQVRGTGIHWNVGDAARRQWFAEFGAASVGAGRHEAIGWRRPRIGVGALRAAGGFAVVVARTPEATASKMTGRPRTTVSATAARESQPSQRRLRRHKRTDERAVRVEMRLESKAARPVRKTETIFA